MEALAGVKCNFDIAFNEPVEQLIAKARNEITSHGGKFEGDLDHGSFSIPTDFGRVVGNYKVQGKTINIKITDKPSIATCKTIESKIRHFLELFER